jgi:hypothetical protein
MDLFPTVKRSTRYVGPCSYPCPECLETFPTVEDLAPHLMAHDPDPKPKRKFQGAAAWSGRRRRKMRWTCWQDGFTTGSGHAWGRHKRGVHGGLDPRDLIDAPA